MANMRDQMRSWTRTATKQIRFGPDREAVVRELLEHIEDKKLDLERIFPDMTGDEAMEMALSQMGDPEEIGRELGKIHKPWLGYIWQASRILLAGAACVLVVSVVNAFYHGLVVDRLEDWNTARRQTAESRVIAQVLYEDAPMESLDPFGQNGSYHWSGVERLALYDDVAQTKRLGEAELTLSRAALWQLEEKRALYAEITVAYDRPWDARPLLQWYLQAEDSLGNHYGHTMTHSETGAHMSGFGSFGMVTHRDGYTWNFGLEDLPEEAEWVRFTYALRPAADFEFVIDLTEGVAG